VAPRTGLDAVEGGDYLYLCSPCGPSPLFHFLNPHTVGWTPWTVYQPVARPLPTHRTTQLQNKRTQTSIHRVSIEPTIPVFERAKTVHALDCAATVIGEQNKLIVTKLTTLQIP
jgi:hypothetical protein